MYAEGRGVARDPKQALEWLRKSANSGFVKAQFAIGRFYARGTGVKRDLPTACFWLSLAQPDPKKPDAQRDQVCSQLDPEQLLGVMIQVAKAQSILEKRSAGK
jgi:hypothetical protein